VLGMGSVWPALGTFGTGSVVFIGTNVTGQTKVMVNLF